MENENKIPKPVLQVLSTSLTLLIGDYLMDSVHFDKPWVAIITALILALLNVFVKPILIALTIPATILTLGLFLLVINAAMLMIADQIVPGFVIESFWSAILFAIFISLVNGLLGGNVRVERHRINKED
ncbi:MAG: phage holin family protein [Flavobacteriales bacterium]|nr:phage holin family protein [Flavobacteriales bacterium]